MEIPANPAPAPNTPAQNAGGEQPPLPAKSPPAPAETLGPGAQLVVKEVAQLKEQVAQLRGEPVETPSPADKHEPERSSWLTLF